MKRPPIAPILGFFLLLAIGVAAYFGIKSNKLENEIQANKTFINQLDEQMAAQQQIEEIDAILMEGNYKKALDAYEEQIDEGEVADGFSVEMRVALIKELLRLQYENRLAALQNAQEQEIDSSLLAAGPRPEDIMQSDSLSFALEKAKVRIECLTRQLKEKSFGEYLTFTNSKGSQMHYVGQVKNGRANGYGVALLNTGSRYEGQWKENMRHGEGTYFWDDGQYYKGEYKNDKRNGQGTYYWPNGEKYAGNWKDDMRSGEGIFYNKEGDVIATGIWKEDKLTDEMPLAAAE